MPGNLKWESSDDTGSAPSWAVDLPHGLRLSVAEWNTGVTANLRGSAKPGKYGDRPVLELVGEYPDVEAAKREAPAAAARMLQAAVRALTGDES